jgi:hypothetical protein
MPMDMVAELPGKNSTFALDFAEETSWRCLLCRKSDGQQADTRVISRPVTRFIFLLFTVLLLFAARSYAGQVSLAWDAVNDTNVAGYKVYYGPQTKTYSYYIDVGQATSVTIGDLDDSATYYSVATAYDSKGTESVPSNEVSYTTPAGCSYTISPAQRTLSASGGTGTISVTTQAGCVWTANGTGWLSVTSGANGTGNGTVGYSVTANSSTSSRTIATSVAGQTFTITQDGLPSYTISASAGTGGSISPAGNVSVASGSSQTFSITPASGYSVSSVTVDGTSIGAVTSRTFTNVTGNHSIAATFVANTFTLTVSKTGTGTGTVTTSPSGSSFTAGSVVTLNASATAGSVFAGWTGACSGTSTTCQVTINSNTSVGASFTINSYTISASAGTGGSISPAGNVSVASGSSQTFSITPASGYKVSYLLVDNKVKVSATSYTFYSVASRHSLSVKFTRLNRFSTTR